MGCMGSFIVAAAYGGLSRDVVIKALTGTVRISVMMFAILIGAIGFSQIMAYSGATRGLLQAVGNLDIHPLLLIVCMQLIILVLGTFMEQVSIMLITLPLYIPIVKFLGYDPIWFGVLMLINLEMALTTPPFGMLLFVMKGVAPIGTKMKAIYLAGLPFLICDLIALVIVLLVPETTTWLQEIFYGK